jgi:hypothetical protein
MGPARRCAVRAAIGLVLACIAPSTMPTSAQTAPSSTSPYSLGRILPAFLAAYNSGDANRLRPMLSDRLQTKYPASRLDEALGLCRVVTHDIIRIGGRAWGNRWHGLYHLDGEGGPLQMIFEIDNHERIIHMMITDDLDAKRQQCWISHLEQ